MRILLTSVLLASGFFALTVDAQQSKTTPAENEFPENAVQPVRCVALSPDGKLLATVTAPNDQQICWKAHTLPLWNTATGKVVRELPAAKAWLRPDLEQPLSIDAAVFSGDGKWLMVCHSNGCVEKWDTQIWKKVRSFSAAKESCSFPANWSLATSHDGVLLATGGLSEVRLWDTTTGNCVFAAGSPENHVVALSRDGKTLAAAGKQMHLWRLHKAIDFYQFALAHGRWNQDLAMTSNLGSQLSDFLTIKVTGLALSSDGAQIVNSQDRKTVRGWGGAREINILTLDDLGAPAEKKSHDWALPACKWLKKTKDGNINSLVLSGDSRWLVGAEVAWMMDWQKAGVYSVHRARLWDARTGEEVRVYNGHTDEILTLSMSADSKLLVTGSSDGTARLWDIATGKEIRVFQ